MAAAYGVEPLVAALVDAGADTACENSLTWTPLLEACHRGFLSIAKLLLACRPDLSHVSRPQWAPAPTPLPLSFPSLPRSWGGRG